MAVNSSSSPGPLRVLEFYSGIGGLHYSLRQAGILAEVVEAFDINDVANDVYEHNFGKRPNQGNIQRLTVEQLQGYEADAWLLSPPCQPYTRQGLKKDAADGRALSFLDILTKLPMMARPPSYIAVENVVGFENSVTHSCVVQNSVTHSHLMESLAICGYRVQEFVLSPIQFGIPYSRPRYFCLARLQWSFPHTVLNGRLLYSALPLLHPHPTTAEECSVCASVSLNSEVSDFTVDTSSICDTRRGAVKEGIEEQKEEGSIGAAEHGLSSSGVNVGVLCRPIRDFLVSEPEDFRGNLQDFSHLHSDQTEVRSCDTGHSVTEQNQDDAVNGFSSSTENLQEDANEFVITDRGNHCRNETNSTCSCCTGFSNGTTEGDVDDSLESWKNHRFDAVAASCNCNRCQGISMQTGSQATIQTTDLEVLECQNSGREAVDPLATELANIPVSSGISVFSVSNSMVPGVQCFQNEKPRLQSCGGVNEWQSYMVPPAVYERWGEAMDIVTESSRRCCCFTKSYVKYAKGTGSVLATQAEPIRGREEEKTPHGVRQREAIKKREEEESQKKGEVKWGGVPLQKLGLRYFTPREVANFHSFPPDFSFPDHISLRQKYALLGNSLSVAVVGSLLSYLFTSLG